MDIYDPLSCDRKKNEGRAAWVKQTRAYSLMTLQMLSLKFFWWKQNPITLWTVHLSLYQTNFIKTLMKILWNTMPVKKSYIFGDSNISLYHNSKYINCKINTLALRYVSEDARNHHRFCKIFALKQILQSANLITRRRTSLIDHILAGVLSQISQHDPITINPGVSNH